MTIPVLQKYDEIVVIPSKFEGGKQYFKGDTIRQVMLTKQNADFNNKNPNLTGCKYVLVDEAKEERAELLQKAKNLQLKVAKNISTKDLKKKVAEAEKALQTPATPDTKNNEGDKNPDNNPEGTEPKTE